jgi:hypothetical protein
MFQVTGEDAGTDVSMTDSHHALRDATVTSLFIETEDKLYKSLRLTACGVGQASGR